MNKDLDMEILKILENDARIPVKDMATMLDTDKKTIEERIAELQKKDVIKKYKTIIDWKKMGKHPVIGLIQVKVVPQESAGFARTCKEISKDSRVKDVMVASGEYDLVVRVETNDIDDLSKFVTEKLAPKKEVVGTYTHIILEEYKRDGVMTFEDKVKRLHVTP